MLHFVKVDIFESPARVLVNPVNCGRSLREGFLAAGKLVL